MEQEEGKTFPSLSGITEDIQTLRLIAPAYAGREGELTAVLQYVYQSIMFGKLGKTQTSEKVLKIAVNEMHHLEVLGKMIAQLGAPPIYTACPPYPVGYYSASCVNYTKLPRQMICADICAEENAISQYERMLLRVRNSAVAQVLAAILQDEREHLQTFNEILSEL